jgi:hypothetical protein
VRVSVVEARGLPPADSDGFSDPYAKVKLMRGAETLKRFQTAFVDKTLNPKWDVDFVFDIPHPVVTLRFTVWDHDTVGSDDFLGVTQLQLSDLDPEKPHDLWLRLRNSEDDDDVDLDKYVGDIHIRVAFIRSDAAAAGAVAAAAAREDDPIVAQIKSAGESVKRRMIALEEKAQVAELKLDATVERVDELVRDDFSRHCVKSVGAMSVRFLRAKKKSSSAGSIFGAVRCGDKLLKTALVEEAPGAAAGGGGFIPMDVDVSVEVAGGGDVFLVQLYEYAASGRHHLLASGEYPVAEFGDLQPRDRTLRGGGGVEAVLRLQFLSNNGGGGGPRSESKDYTPLAALFKGYPSVMAGLLDAADSADVEHLVAPLTRIAAANGSVEGLLTALVGAEVGATLSEGTLFRRNSAASKMTSCWGRMVKARPHRFVAPPSVALFPNFDYFLGLAVVPLVRPPPHPLHPPPPRP